MKKNGVNARFFELTQMFPYNDEIYQIRVTGKQFKDMMNHLFRPDALEYDHSEFYQFSSGVYLSAKRVIYLLYFSVVLALYL